ncbi:transglycosylase domain-containing protein [Caryophanon tenue]|uniref:Peptidoglycan glycosyltransferase n=1 Tax=Caryophanon tenue TaxID=33978 RepID=A0A1C0YME2_9BACL|nr:transglycosylase domain-containing protein [Caryophanon tenue]OCS88321.1 peptidoglycan glycosyltransferase [Caryophanon tenue]
MLKKINDFLDRVAAHKLVPKLRITGNVLWNLALFFLVLTLVGGVFVASVGAGYFAALVREEPLRASDEMREEIFSYEETSEIYFADDIYIGKVRTDLERRETSLTSVSTNVVNAVLATEDEHFREHNGIVPKAVLRGLVQDVTNSSSQTGGSTLTQQLIKNQILTNEVSYERKAKEILLAMRLEHFMTKEEILEAYLNIIPYGRNADGRNIAGVATAAEGIFGTTPDKLNLAQSAYIAGIPQAPFKYTPFTSRGELKGAEGLQPGIDRMKTVLFRMKEEGFITEAEYNEAAAYDIVADFRTKQASATDLYPYITYEVERRTTDILMEMLAEKDGVTKEQLTQNEQLYEKYQILADRDMRSSGYRIYTTIDKTMYDAMNKAAAEFELYGQTLTSTATDPETGETIEIKEPVQVSSVLMDSKTGRIISFVGGRDFEITEFNYATQGVRSLGSTVKPLLVYAPALEYGFIGAGSPVVDVRLGRGDWDPKNFIPTQELGLIPARKALASSQNLAAIRLFAMQLQEYTPGEFLQKMNPERITMDHVSNPSAALGAGVETTVAENTASFAAFANEGTYNEGYMIAKIEDLDGNLIYEHELNPTPVFSPETAYIISDMLKDTFKQGGTTNRAANLLKFNPTNMSAKTGTSQFFHDVWVMAYNPNITLSAWMGYGKPKPLDTMSNTYGQPSTRINTLWATLMNTVYATDPELVNPNTKMERPENVVSKTFCGISGRALSNACSAAGFAETDLFNAKVFVPIKADDSITASSAVTIRGQKYQPLNGTPSAFITSGGVALSPSFAKRMLGTYGGDASKLISGASYGGGAVSSMGDDGAAPSAPSAAVSGSTLSWSASSSRDVVGYYIYRQGGGRIATVAESSSRARTINYGSYYVTAVDIAGRESGASNVVSYSAPVVTEPEPEERPTESNTNNSSSGGNSLGSDSSSGSGGSSSGSATEQPSEPEPEPEVEEPAAEEPTPPASEGESESGE